MLERTCRKMEAGIKSLMGTILLTFFLRILELYLHECNRSGGI